MAASSRAVLAAKAVASNTRIGSVLAVEVVETKSRGSVLAAEVVETQRGGSVREGRNERQCLSRQDTAETHGIGSVLAAKTE